MMNLPDVFDAILEAGGDLAVSGPERAGRALVAAYLKRKADIARDILFDEIRRGEKLPPQVASIDDAVAVLYRYLRAANEGAARVNLRLLAKAIVGQMRTGTLVADEFLLYADALASLSRDEIIVIAALWSTQPSWVHAEMMLKSEGWEVGRAHAAATRALRSGLVIAMTMGGGADSGGQFLFSPSRMMTQLAKTIDFEDALRAEAIAP